MRPEQINHNLLHPVKNRTWKPGDRVLTALAGIIGAFIGLLLGMTALVAFFGSQAATEAGRPGMLLIKVIVVGTFVILSVILFTCGFRDGEDKD